MASKLITMRNISASDVPLRPANSARHLLLLALFPSLMLLAGCAARNKAYPGPKLDNSDVGIVVPGTDYGLRKNYVAVLEINGQDEMEEWEGGNFQPIYLLPGNYRFRVEYKQTTQATTIPIVDLVTSIQDMTAAVQNSEINIEFPVTAGLTHHIHFDAAQKVFSVSHGTPDQLDQLSPTQTNDRATPCVQTPDRDQDLWCGLIADSEEP